MVDMTESNAAFSTAKAVDRVVHTTHNETILAGRVAPRLKMLP